MNQARASGMTPADPAAGGLRPVRGGRRRTRRPQPGRRPALGSLAVEIYDRPLMTINYARSAAMKLAKLDGAVTAAPAKPAAERARLAADLVNRIDDIVEDLGVVAKRAPDARGRALVDPAQKRLADGATAPRRR